MNNENQKNNRDIHAISDGTTEINFDDEQSEYSKTKIQKCEMCGSNEVLDADLEIDLESRDKLLKSIKIQGSKCSQCGEEYLNFRELNAMQEINWLINDLFPDLYKIVDGNRVRLTEKEIELQNESIRKFKKTREDVRKLALSMEKDEIERKEKRRQSEEQQVKEEQQIKNAQLAQENKPVKEDRLSKIEKLLGIE